MQLKDRSESWSLSKLCNKTGSVRTYNLTFMRVRITIFLRGKAINNIFSNCTSVAFVIQHTKRMRRIVICSLSGCNIFSPLSHILQDFRKIKLFNIKCVFWLCIQTLKQFLVWIECSEILSYVYLDLHVKYPLFLSDFSEIGIFWTDFRKCSYQISWKSVLWEPIAPFERTDRHDEADVHFSQLCERA